MIELSKHIEILLLKHNCVIVPGLGGFIAQDVAARYIPEENIFLPPHRTVGFNPLLNLNDGLLVQSYMQAYDTNYPESLKLIKQAVADLKLDIQEKGVYEFNSIGNLSINIDGQYEFIPNEAGIISPSLYGLDAVTVKKENSKAHTESSKHAEKTERRKISNNGKNYTLNINKEFVNYVAAAVISIFFYFLWATPVTDSSSLNNQQASMLFPRNVQHLPKVTPAPIEIDSLYTSSEVAPPQQETITTEEQNEPTGIEDVQEVKKNFTIVLVSCIPEKNAERFQSELLKEGYENVSILKRRNIIRVVFNTYTTESEAHSDLSKLRNQSKRFKDAWILKL